MTSIHNQHLSDHISDGLDALGVDSLMDEDDELDLIEVGAATAKLAAEWFAQGGGSNLINRTDGTGGIDVGFSCTEQQRALVEAVDRYWERVNSTDHPQRLHHAQSDLLDDIRRIKQEQCDLGPCPKPKGHAGGCDG